MGSNFHAVKLEQVHSPVDRAGPWPADHGSNRRETGKVGLRGGADIGPRTGVMPARTGRAGAPGSFDAPEAYGIWVGRPK